MARPGDAGSASVDSRAPAGDLGGLNKDSAPGRCDPAPSGALPAGACTYAACGGDPVGEWNLVAWCEGTGAASSGRLSMRADRTFEFVLHHHGGNPKEANCNTPQTGTWETMGSKIIFRRAVNSPTFAFGGAVARGAEWYSYCVNGDSFKHTADHTQPRWVYVRK